MKDFRFILLLVVAAFFFNACGEEVPEPNARFTAEVNSLTVKFTDSSQDAETRSWDFGDNNSSTEVSPEHTYAAGGTYTVVLTVTNATGTDTDSQDIMVAQAFGNSFLAGDWRVPAQEGILSVGPELGSTEWWSMPEGDLPLRACAFDDVYTFDADGNFSINFQGETFLEPWQGTEFACGAPVAPHDGSGSYTYETTSNSLTLKGQGAFLGLAKVVNAGELPNVATPDQVTYDITSFSLVDGKKSMTLNVMAGDGVFWTMGLVSE